MSTQFPAIGGDVFEVEKILRKRRTAKGISYLVKWRHFPSSDNTWEPACNFSQDLIDDFEASHRSKKQKLTPTTAAKSTPTSKSAAGAANSDHQPTPSSSSSSSTSSSINSIAQSSTFTSNRDDYGGSSSSNQLQHQQTSLNSESRVSRKIRRDQRRQQQVKLQLHIQQQQRSQVSLNRQQLAVFNPNGTHRLPVVEEVVYEPKLTREPIIVTDVTSKDSTVTISECKTPEGFFSVNIDFRDKKS